VTDGRGIDAIVGPVHRPGDTRYDEARAIYNRLYRARPALVIRPVDGHDVARALAYAHREGYEVAVRGGGHSLAGFGTTERGLLIDLADLDEIDVDAQTRTATAGGGVHGCVHGRDLRPGVRPVHRAWPARVVRGRSGVCSTRL
jgi:hypothetical protein